MKHFVDSEVIKNFLLAGGIEIVEICHNAVTLYNVKTGQKVVLVAESDNSIAAGIPGIYVEE